MSNNRKNSITFYKVSDDDSGQRLDNLLFRFCKGIPKSHIYQIIRSGEVRVNKGRIKADYRIKSGDTIRIPPLRLAESRHQTPIPDKHFSTIYEDETMLVINKPAGIAVHGGSGISYGIIEQIRKTRPDYRYLELAHRLDKETSGLLILAKKRSALVKLHEMQRQGEIKKYYCALAVGEWPQQIDNVKLPLTFWHNTAGEKMVKVDENGMYAHTIFTIEKYYNHFSLLKIQLKTGRTHQIRVHMQYYGHPIAGDERYGDFNFNKSLIKQGLKRMFLHAQCLVLSHPLNGAPLTFSAPLPTDLTQFLERQH